MIDQLFSEARTFSAWQDRAVEKDTLYKLYDTFKWGPTAANGCPGRFVFVTSAAGKARLKPHLDKGNIEKTMAAPVTVIMAYDLKFYERLDFLFPHASDAASWFRGNTSKIQDTAFRNGTLQAAYLMIAARALGLDCGPMSGFDVAGVRKEFFQETEWVPNFLCNIGYGDKEGLFPRLPRLGFDEACKVV